MFGRGRKRNNQSDDFSNFTPEEAAKRHAKIRNDKDRKLGLQSDFSGAFTTLGDVQSIVPIDNGVRIMTDNGSLSLVFMTPHIIQVRVRPDRNFPSTFSYAIDDHFKAQPMEINIEDTESMVQINSGNMACSVTKNGSSLTFLMGEQIVCADAVDGIGWRDTQVKWTRYLSNDEACYGLGQRAHSLNLRGRSYSLWNYDMVGYQRDTDPVYYSIPFYMGLHPDYALGILWDNPARGTVDLGDEQPDQMSFSAEGGELRFYLIADQTPHTVLKQYIRLTGKPFLPPLWAFGYHQSRWGYETSNKFRDIAREFRSRKIPCDVLHFDIDYMDGYRVFTHSQEEFRDLPRLIENLKAQGFKSIAILDPAIKIDKDYETYTDGMQKGVFHYYPDGDIFSAPVWAGESVFPDFTNPETRSWWAEWVAKLLERVQFDGLWNDMNEPTVFFPDGVAGTVADYVTANWDGYVSNHRNGAHNLYGMQMARATFDGLKTAYPKRRPFTLTRAAYAGSQRFTASWTGDNTASWDHLKLTVSMLLNLNLSGMYFTGPDIGGFFGEPTPELYARWIQLGSMLPFFRTHAMKETPPQEPWVYGEEVEKISKEYIELRYRLLPYIYSSYVQAVQNGLPFIRPTFLFERNDTRLYEQDDVFMVGNSLLIAPILEEGQTEKTFFLPKGIWFDYWTRKRVIGGRNVTVEAPLNRMPIFVLSGHTIPMWEVQQYVGEKEKNELQLLAFMGNSESSLYEDSGDGYTHRDGDYRWSYFTCEMLPKEEFSFKLSHAGSYEPGYKQIRLEMIGIPSEPKEVFIDDELAPVWYFDNGTLEVLSSPFSHVRVLGNPDPTTAQTIVSRPDSF